VDPRASYRIGSMARNSIYIQPPPGRDSLEAPEMRLFARSTFCFAASAACRVRQKELINILNLARMRVHSKAFAFLLLLLWSSAHWFGWNEEQRLQIFSPLTHSTTSRASLIWLSINHVAKNKYLRQHLILLSKSFSS